MLCGLGIDLTLVHSTRRTNSNVEVEAADYDTQISATFPHVLNHKPIALGSIMCESAQIVESRTSLSHLSLHHIPTVHLWNEAYPRRKQAGVNSNIRFPSNSIASQ